MPVSGTQNVCQYWRTDEPAVCGHWDITIPICTKEDADFYPYCNLLGTNTKCRLYNGSGTQSMCVRPDPSRTIGNRRTGTGWVRLPTWSGGNIIEAGSFDAISKYNDGKCDGKGTASKCTGYAPYILGFSVLEPDDKDGTKKIDEGSLTTISGFNLRLPLGFEIYNRRALLGRCFWWQGNSEDFTVPTTISSAEPPMVVNSVPFLCTNPDVIVNEYNDFKWDPKLGMYRPPCNGAKPECPNYASNICWQYCVDEKMQSGDKVLAEQILELRYYIRRDRWDEDKYIDAFKYPDIQSWEGSIIYDTDLSGNINALIPAKRVFISNFENFTIDSNKATLVAGTPSEDGRTQYPTLVEELKNIILAPIIKNVFEEMDGVGKIFETSNIDHKIIPIFGDIFYYNSDTYGINLSDPDLRLPSYIIDIFRTFDNMEEAKANLPMSFDDIYNDIENILDIMIKTMPDKMVISKLGRENNFFYIDMPTFFGDNEIVVLNKGSGIWEFDKIKFKKLFCGGVIGQTSFSLIGKGYVDYLPDYGSDLKAYENDNGTIEFNFFPLRSYVTKNSNKDTSDVSYIYNDSVRKQLPANPDYPPDHITYDMYYKLYKIKAFPDPMILSMENMKFFGNAGYVLVTIPDENKILTRVIRPWEVDGDIYLNIPLNGSDESVKIKMEIFDQDNDHLEPNQLILRPSNFSEFKTPCNGSFIILDNIYIYEKRSFNEEPSKSDDYEIISESFINDDDYVIYRDMEIKSLGKNKYQLKKFGYDVMTIGAVFKGITGWEKGQVKTKMITWIRQPYCRDVEIMYSWKAGYTSYTLLPELWCYGQTGIRADINTHYHSYTPPCGDHSLSFFSRTGPMWYPYVSCDDVAYYHIVSQLTENDISMMEVFRSDYPADPPHGRHDIRMLGPADNFGYTCDNHASIWNCHCDWSFCNDEKKTQNVFTGYGRYRCGVTGYDKYMMLRYGGSPPKFGNPYRDFLRSYRSVDNIDYYYWTGTSFMRKRKWVPMAEFYTSLDLGASLQKYPYLSYSSSDYYDDGAPFINPMGLLMATGGIEGITINEQIDGNNNPNRYRFDDIFRVHYSLEGIYYPYPKHVYYKKVGNVLTPIISWYTYRDYPGDNDDVSIQWAWQEKWKDLERQIINFEDMEFPSVDNKVQCCKYINLDKMVSKPYTQDDDNIPVGKHVFMDIDYPDYRYDYMLKEHRLVAEEGEYDIIVTPPTFNIVNGVIDSFFWGQIDYGPYRAFDIDGNWDPDGCDMVGPNGSDHNEYYNLYTKCTDTQLGWVDDVTLFAPGYTNDSKSVAEDEGRVILTTDDLGEEIKTYYQRGLNINLNNRIDTLATQTNLLPFDVYDIIFSSTPDCTYDVFNDFSTVEPGDPYPGKYDLDVSYCMSAGADSTVSVEFIIRHESETGTEDSGIGIISGIECEFGYGFDIKNNVSYLFHIPSVTINVNDNNVYTCDKMCISDNSVNFEIKKCVYTWEIPSRDLFNFKKSMAEERKYKQAHGDSSPIITKVKLIFRISPTSEELKMGIGDNYMLYKNIVNIKTIRLYHSNFIKSKEHLKVYERKYNISYGSHGDIPPHGRDNTGSLLYPTPTDLSSVYQYDTRNGVVGLPASTGSLKMMNKVRGRIVKECHDDKEPIDGPSDLFSWEEKQKEIYDEIAINSGDTTFTLEASAVPILLKDKLESMSISFPVWRCTFTNTMVRPLKQVNHYSTYSPCGHRFKHDFQHMIKRVCGPGHVEDVFDYIFVSACPEYSHFGGTVQVDAVVAYYRGIGNVLIYQMDYINRLMSPVYGAAYAESVWSEWYDSIELSFPESVTMLN